MRSAVARGWKRLGLKLLSQATRSCALVGERALPAHRGACRLCGAAGASVAPRERASVAPSAPALTPHPSHPRRWAPSRRL